MRYQIIIKVMRQGALKKEEDKILPHNLFVKKLNKDKMNLITKHVLEFIKQFVTNRDHPVAKLPIFDAYTVL